MYYTTKFIHQSTAIKAAFVAISIVFISSCVSTEEAQESETLVDINSQLIELLKEADLSGNSSEKPALASFADKAYAKAKALEGKQQSKLALGFYQVASQAYWRDDIASNNVLIFDIAGTVEELCTELGEQAPDRDCFVSPLIEHLANIEIITINPGLTLRGTDPSKTEVATSRDLLLSLGQKSSDQALHLNGALTNLMNYAVVNQPILGNHPGLKGYVCSNLVSVFDVYVRGVFALEGYYKEENAVPNVNVEDEHPLFTTFFESVGTQGTLTERVKKFVSIQVPSCPSSQ